MNNYRSIKAKVKKNNSNQLNSLTDQERKILFPNGPVSLKELKKRKNENKK